MTKTTNKRALMRSSAMLCVGSLALLAASTPALAQASKANEQVNERASNLSEIVVTARKKSENILDIPLAITALPSAEIQRKGIDSLEKVSAFTPALSVSSFGASISNRSQQTVIIRGTTPASAISNTTTVFLNGAPLGASGLIDGIGDVAQVEVIKGPQSAYFGRSTFGGAINLVTKKPANEFAATIDALYGSYNWTDVKGTVEGPIIKDKLAFRINARYYKIDGQYDNVNMPGSPFGRQESKNISGELTFTPFEGLEIRAFGIYIKQDDGQSAMQKYKRSDFNCTISPGQRFLCGVAPELPESRLGVNTTLPVGLLDFLNNNPLRYKNIGLDHFGVAVQTKIGNLIVNYDLPYNVRFTSVTAGNETFADSITDLVNEYQTSRLLRFPFDTYNYNSAFSQEFRLTSDQSKRLRGAVGANYYYTHGGQTNMGDSGTAGFLSFGASSLVLDRTRGVFGSLAFDITPQLILNLEGRYQNDTAFGVARTVVNGSAVERKVPGLKYSVNQFLPRVILQYKFMPGQQVYATYSKGANPGIFNTGILNQRPAVQALVIAQSGAGPSSNPEELQNYEIGYKGSLFNGRLQLDADIYRAHWTNQLVQQSFFISDPALTGTTATIVVGAYSNNGDTDLQGIEGNAFLKVTDRLSASLGGAINETKINKYTNAGAAALLGAPLPPPLTLFAGKELPNYSKYSATAAVDYEQEFSNNLLGFAHADYVYKSGMYESPGNFVRSSATHRVNLRVGVERDDKKLEAFVDNVFDNQAYASFTNQVDLNDGNLRIAYGALPFPRRFGVRFHAGF